MTREQRAGINRGDQRRAQGAAAAGIIGMLYGKYRYGKPDVILTIMGFLGGLVSVSSAAGHLNSRAAVFIGAVAGLLVPIAVVWIDLMAHLDDPAGVIAIHGIGGLWGTIAVGLFKPGTFGQRFHQVGVQILGVFVIALISFTLGGIVCFLLRKLTRLRPSEDDEFDGLDLKPSTTSGAYPDFQQTTIKSYHLREAYDTLVPISVVLRGEQHCRDMIAAAFLGAFSFWIAVAVSITIRIAEYRFAAAG